MQTQILTEIFSLLSQWGVKDVICSPGSRNAALLSGCDYVKDLRKHVVVDERSAAFIGLGIAMVSKAPVALVCTSGTALLNYAPAVAEAFYQGIPLIVISADRPQEWIDQDDSQTIRQPGVLSHFVKGSYDIDGTRYFDPTYEWHVNLIFNEGIEKAIRMKPGPVHFNVHLDGNVDEDYDKLGYVKKISTILPQARLSPIEIREWGDMASGCKVMLVAGFMQPDHKLQKAVSTLASLPNVCVMAETLSNLHLPREAYMVDTVLFSMDSAKEKELAPDILISLGGALVSRKLKEFLRRNPPKFFNLSLSYSDNLIDCFQSLNYKLECNPASFLQAMAKRMQRMQQENGDYPLYKQVWDDERKLPVKDFSHIPWSDLKALKIVFDALPEETNLFLSNGTSVRYGQIIPYRLTHAAYSNRGVSGIEGCTSTAVGASMMYDRLTCLITGDMSFGYDLGGLSSGLEPDRLRVVVLDNGGGDIFRLINATKDLSIREEYLCVDREVPVGLLADAYGWIYYYADTEEILKDNLKEFFNKTMRPAILHVDTRGVTSNSEILRNFLLNK